VTITPPPPTSLAGLVEAYADTTAAAVRLGAQAAPEAAGLPTDCPGWTVLDQLRHIVSIEGMLLGDPLPDVDVSGRAHVRSAFGEVIEKYLEGHRARTLTEVVEDLRQVRDQRLAVLSAPGLTLESETVGPFGQTTLGALVGLRCFDIWCHEQDLREALDVPGGMDTPAAANAVSRMLHGLPKVLSAGALAEGEVVVLDIVGPVQASFAVTVRADEAGRLRGHVVDAAAVPSAATRIGLSARAFTRRAAGRWALDRVDAVVDGDDALAERVLQALDVTP